MLNFQSKRDQTKRKLQHQKTKTNTTRGFTLLELIIVIIILGVMAVGISGFITLTTQTYLNVSERDDLLSSARFAVERLNREIRNAVPNSIRVENDTARQCLEFVPIVASTIYTDVPVSPEPGRLEVLVIPFQEGNADYSCPAICQDKVVVYPLTSDDVYVQDLFSGTGKAFSLNIFSPPVGLNEWSLPLLKPFSVDTITFEQDSPTKRLYIFKDPVSYCVDSGELIRYEGHSFSSTQILKPTSSKAIMAENIAAINLGDLPFTIQPASLQRNALVQIKLQFNRDGENIVFNNEVHLNNVP